VDGYDSVVNSSQETVAHRGENYRFGGEIVFLQQEIQNLKQRISDDKNDIRERLKSLEAEALEFNRKFTFGKGIFYGVVAVLGTLGVVVVDRLKDLMALLK